MVIGEQGWLMGSESTSTQRRGVPRQAAARSSSGAHGFRGSLAVAGGLAGLILCRHCQKGR